MYCDSCSQYTIKKTCNCNGKEKVTRSAHPSRFSPDDTFSAQRITLKKRHNILPTQYPPVKY